MPEGLNVSRLINVQASLSPLAAVTPGYGILLLAGDTVDAQGVAIIDGVERIRTYTDIDGVLDDFSSSDPEAVAAALYFGQSPHAKTLAIGSYLRTAQPGFLKGAALTTAEQTLATWTAISNGSLRIAIDGAAAANKTGLDFSAAGSLSAVAAIIDTAIAGATVQWTGSRFRIVSSTTGAASEISYATTATASVGTDISAMLKLTALTATSKVTGIAAEAPADAAAALADKSGVWYALQFAASIMPSDAQDLAVAAYIESTGANLPRIYGITTDDTTILDSEVDDDIASELAALDRERTLVLYSQTEHAVASLFSRAFAVDFTAADSTITLMYKTLPGVTAETLTESQAATLEAKRCNVYALYNNGKSIVQFGVMSGDAYIDERHELDWFVGTLQNAIFNRFYQTKGKVPQTNAGMQQLVNVAATVCGMARNNGMIAGGQWNADGFGIIEFGSALPSGFYVYAPLVESQDQAIREQRTAPTMQIALKLAGAYHRSNVLVDVNR